MVSAGRDWRNKERVRGREEEQGGGKRRGRLQDRECVVECDEWSCSQSLPNLFESLQNFATLPAHRSSQLVHNQPQNV